MLSSFSLMHEALFLHKSWAVQSSTKRKSHFSCMCKNCCKYPSIQPYSNENESNTGSDKDLNIARCSGTYYPAVCRERPCSCRSLTSLWHRTNGCDYCFTMEILLATALYEFPAFSCYHEVSSCSLGKLLRGCARTLKIYIMKEIVLEAVKFWSFPGSYMGCSS